MDDVATRKFKRDLPCQCEILETKSNTSIYHEFVAALDKTPAEYSGYCSRWAEMVVRWNSIMKESGLEYRFKDTIGARQNYRAELDRAN
jgi:hypothetical protein